MFALRRGSVVSSEQSTMTPAEPASQNAQQDQGLIQGLGLLQSVALNMSNMIGVGPFITIPLILGAMGGPQCLLGWVLGALLAMCDGLVWSELSAALPGTGGSYVYLKEAFRGTRLGGILPLPFHLAVRPERPARNSIGLYRLFAVCGLSVARHGNLGRQTGECVRGSSLDPVIAVSPYHCRGRADCRPLGGRHYVTVLCVVVSGLLHFHANLAFDFPPGAFRFSTGFAAGLGSGYMLICSCATTWATTVSVT